MGWGKLLGESPYLLPMSYRYTVEVIDVQKLLLVVLLDLTDVLGVVCSSLYPCGLQS